ncbi:hypothetical protein L6452_18724 [Arctium lappa]|uniref:Uncharacterized protein n=1 Tax=Arctium lappa TaxID=4217 RepID=A0ACB9C748_ARCLA|nr:hypothetical protein L6452_18724 [Arctium lappa]
MLSFDCYHLFFTCLKSAASPLQIDRSPPASSPNRARGLQIGTPDLQVFRSPSPSASFLISISKSGLENTV